MTPSPTFRTLSAALLAVALGLAALPGCGNKPTPTQPEKKEDPKPEPKVDPKIDPKVDPKKEPTPVEPKSTLGDVEKVADDTATAFFRELGQGTATADALSTNFVKAVGKPIEPLPEDMKNGYSRSNATRWLKQVGDGYTFGLLYRKQAGDAVYYRGTVNGRQLPPAGGSYSLRLLKEGSAWKVDALVVTSLENKGGIAATTADEAFQEFAVVAFVEATCDKDAMTNMTVDARPPALARLMTDKLRKEWAAPGKQDQDQGYDYSPGNLRFAAVRHGGGTSAFTVSKGGDLTFSVALGKPAGTKTVVVKLVKGATPGEWLVNEVTEPKG